MPDSTSDWPSFAADHYGQIMSMTSNTPRGRCDTYKCARCEKPFTARVADRERGWAKFCSKSCKAKKQEARTGQHKAYLAGREHSYQDVDDDPSWDAHKSY